MSRRDRPVLWALQALVVGLPFVSGGNRPVVIALALPIALALLAVTLRARKRAAVDMPAPGVGALAAFSALALVTTLPLPPLILGWIAPATFRLYAETLPGWPGADAWSTWRSLAIDPYGVWIELGRLAAGFAVFAVLVAYPWAAVESGEASREDQNEEVLARMLGTALAAGTLFSALALLQQIAGNGSLADAESGRVSGPFVNPNHFAAWLEMLIPAALAYLLALGARLRRRLAAAAAVGRSMGVRPRRAWVAALIAHQRRLWPPLSAATGLTLMLVAHAASGSRGGTAALLVGCAVAAAGMAVSTRRRDGLGTRRWLPVGLALVLLLASTIVVALWSQSDDEQAGAVTDVSLASRLAVTAQGVGIVREHPLFGTGLGSWLHAFRPHQAPPVEGGIWDHAHNDYLELAADGGLAALVIACLFALAVARAARGVPTTPASEAERARRRAEERPPGFERPEWRAAFGEGSYLRWGLAGGLAAILVHSFVEFALRMPANLALLMMLAALLVVSARPRGPATQASGEAEPPWFGAELLQLTGPAAIGRHAPALAVLLAAFTVAALPQAANYVLTVADAAPLAPHACLARADLTQAEGGEGSEAQASALVRRALDRSPADREAHEALASVLGPGAEGDAALRRALALEPWSATVRDQLALRLWTRGERDSAAREFEESMFRFPYLVSHAYLDPAMGGESLTSQQLLRALADGDTLASRVADLEPEIASAVERGLRRARELALAGPQRAGIVRDLVLVLEARERFADAADLLRAEAEREVDGGRYLAHAANNYLKAHDIAAAEATLLAALLQRPEEGILYRRLAVDVYAARGDFETAQTVLKAAERNAVDLLPVYRAVTEVLGRREAARQDELVQAIALEMPAKDAIVEDGR